ncbi:hypothetical protein HDV06_003496 [Boothiomyces sp. JEL0866]|nr:hypothetical protein HDV06_003465 [Boothiomyces sp. JEL0866]KAJ3325726.1 hypothetical protein HDV06_003496 [Boothiomyces sp. JEL0866]
MAANKILIHYAMPISRLGSSLVGKECSGCGSIFQNHSEEKPGYLPPIQERKIATPQEIERLERKTEPLTQAELKILLQKHKKPKAIVCKRCHSILKGDNTTRSMKTNRIQFGQLKAKSGGLVILLLDLMDLPQSFVKDLWDYVGNKKLVLALNKYDLMPANYDLDTVKKWVQRQEFAKGAPIIPLSATTGEGIQTLVKFIGESFKQNEDCYLVGCTNVGKSSFMNSLKKQVGDNKYVTASAASGTTAGLIRMPKSSLLPLCSKVTPGEMQQSKNRQIENYLIDTAGIINQEQLAHLFTTKELAIIEPKSQIKARLYEREKGQSLWIGGFCRIDVLDGGASLSVYVSQKLPIHESKMINNDRLLQKVGSGNILFPPMVNLRDIPLPGLQPRHLTLKGAKTIWISSVGWISVAGTAEIEIYTPEGRGVYISSLIVCKEETDEIKLMKRKLLKRK